MEIVCLMIFRNFGKVPAELAKICKNRRGLEGKNIEKVLNLEFKALSIT